MSAQSQQTVPDQVASGNVETKDASSSSSVSTSNNTSSSYAERRAKAERIYSILVKELGAEAAMHYMDELRDEFKSTFTKDFDSILPAYSALRELDESNKTKFSENKDMLKILVDPLIQSFVCSMKDSMKRPREELTMKSRSTVPLHTNERSNEGGSRMTSTATKTTDMIDDWFAGIKRP